MPANLFHGGIHPPEYKTLTAKNPIVNAELCGKVRVPMHKNPRFAANPIVNKGDHVYVGQLIADSELPNGLPVHSPISGNVTAIDYGRDGSGTVVLTIEITSDGLYESQDIYHPIKSDVSLEEFISIIKKGGISGMGGAEFPTFAKFVIPENTKIDTLLINGSECEPYLTSDYRTMVERADEIIRGVEIITKAASIPKCVIGIEDNKPDAIEAIKSKLVDKPFIEVSEMKTVYPQGSEKHLIKSTLDRIVPMRMLPINVGVIVLNVSTVAAIADLFDKGIPLIERVVTVSGGAIVEPKNIKAKIGTSVQELIDMCGGFKEEPAKIILGGPMMGVALSNTNVPITKGSSGILALTESEAKIYKPLNCIRCGTCVANCPMQLEPATLHQLCEANILARAEEYNVIDCIECGVCSYVCPSRRNLVQSIKVAKYNIAKNRLRQIGRA